MKHSFSRMGIGVGLVAMVAVGLGIARARTAAAQGAELHGLNGDQGVMPRAKIVPQRQWEYKQAGPCTASRGRMPFEEELNELGRHGWELVSLVPRQGSQAQDCYLATFKREMAH